MGKKPFHFRARKPGSREAYTIAVRDRPTLSSRPDEDIEQVNNVLGFPYMFRGALDVRPDITKDDWPPPKPSTLARGRTRRVLSPMAAAHASAGLHHSQPFDSRGCICGTPPWPRVQARSARAIDSGEYRALPYRPIRPSGGLFRITESAKGDPHDSYPESENDNILRAPTACGRGPGAPIVIAPQRIRGTRRKRGSLGRRVIGRSREADSWTVMSDLRKSASARLTLHTPTKAEAIAPAFGSWLDAAT